MYCKEIQINIKNLKNVYNMWSVGNVVIWKCRLKLL